MKENPFFVNSKQLILTALLMSVTVQVSAANTWTYHQESERLTNQSYSFAQSPRPESGLYDNIKLEIVCRQNLLQIVVNTDSLIASQNSKFDVEYQVDKQLPVKIKMTTFPDSKRKGYSTEDAKRLADNLLTGQTVFIRINTLIKKELASSITLEGVAKPVQQVFADCGLSASVNAVNEPAYSLAEFEQDFAKLTPEQQQQALVKIKKIIMEIP